MRNWKGLAAIAALALAVAVPAAFAAQAKPKPGPHGVKAAKHVKVAKRPVAKKLVKKPTAPPLAQGIQHVFVIMLENHSAQGVIGDANAPNITALAAKYAVASNYYGVTHPSLPNYVALLSGSNWWSNSDDPSQRFDHRNLVDELEAAHKTWAGYMEALPTDKTADFWPSSTDPLYASKHDPFVLFDDIRNSPARLAHVKEYGSLATDLKKVSTTPNFAFITPDQCDDMHGGVYDTVPGHPETPCPYGSTNDDANDAALKQKADAFVKKTVDEITASPAWSTSAIFVVADEGDYTGNAQNGGWDSPAGCCDSPSLPKGDPDVSAAWPGGLYGGALVPAVVITAKGKSGGYRSTTAYNHYSLLATVEDLFHLDRIGFASDTVQVKPMTEFFSK